MQAIRCSHPDCTARMPRRVNFCPWCGARQVREEVKRPVAQPVPVAVPAPPRRQPVPAPAERKTGIGFWIVALAIVFSFWLSFSGDPEPSKLRHNAGQQQRK